MGNLSHRSQQRPTCFACGYEAFCFTNILRRCLKVCIQRDFFNLIFVLYTPGRESYGHIHDAFNDDTAIEETPVNTSDRRHWSVHQYIDSWYRKILPMYLQSLHKSNFRRGRKGNRYKVTHKSINSMCLNNLKNISYTFMPLIRRR